MKKVVTFAALLILIIFTLFSCLTGEVTMNVKDSVTRKYVIGGVIIKPELEGTAGPGTDSAGPFSFMVKRPVIATIIVSAEGYESKKEKHLLLPFKTYTFYLDKVHVK